MSAALQTIGAVPIKVGGASYTSVFIIDGAKAVRRGF
jgi:hypothetical protein